MQRDGRNVTVEVTSDGEGLVSHAGSALLAQVADKSGLTQALSVRLAGLKQRQSGHDPGRVVRDLAVMLADGGDCLADLGTVRDQDALFGSVASDSTAFRVVDRIACTPGLLDAVVDAHAVARERVWALTGPPDRVTIDVDANRHKITREHMGRVLDRAIGGQTLQRDAPTERTLVFTDNRYSIQIGDHAQVSNSPLTPATRSSRRRARARTTCSRRSRPSSAVASPTTGMTTPPSSSRRRSTDAKTSRSRTSAMPPAAPPRRNRPSRARSRRCSPRSRWAPRVAS